jgi:hypothetical protein
MTRKNSNPYTRTSSLGFVEHWLLMPTKRKQWRHGSSRGCQLLASSPRQWIWLGGGTQNALFLLMAELREQGIVSRRGALARP